MHAMQLSKQTLDVGLVTKDLPAARQFYAEVMGFSLVAPAPGAATRFLVGGHLLEIREAVVGAERDQGGVDRATGMRLLAFILDDLDAVLRRFDALGLLYQTMPLPADTPFRVAFAADPDGNALELVGLRQPLGAAFEARLQIGLTVVDPNRMKQFYAMLGFAEQPDMPLPSSMGVAGDVRYAVTAGATTVKFWQIAGALPAAGGAPEQRTGIRAIYAQVADLEATCAELAARAVPIERLTLPQATAGKRSRVRILDPDGNRIELVSQ
jgi:catechol 2,3-dioxygenase-like lactoylglutathione lyase family enzyme